MGLGLTISPDTQHKILAHLCERNQSAELVHRPEGGDPMHAKVRFLLVTEHGFWIDQPTKFGRPVLLREADEISLLFLWGDQRLAFSSQVIERGQCVVRDGPRVNGLRVAFPERIEKAQRRSCYRVSMIHYPNAAIQFFRIGESQEAFHASMLNLSETGCGVIASAVKAADVLEGELYDTRFLLPGESGDIELPAEVRWKRKTEDRRHLEIGLQWQLDGGDMDARRIQRRLALFIANEQRLALHRQRELRRSE
jgi:c-di-GMP-binding flagellar brake protein YcgR